MGCLIQVDHLRRIGPFDVAEVDVVASKGRTQRVGPRQNRRLRLSPLAAVLGAEAVGVGEASDVDDLGDPSLDRLVMGLAVGVTSTPPLVDGDVGGEEDEARSDFLISSEVADADLPAVADLLPEVELDLALELVEQKAAMHSCVVAFEAQNITRLSVPHSVHMLRPTADGIGDRGFTHSARPMQYVHLYSRL